MSRLLGLCAVVLVLVGAAVLVATGRDAKTGADTAPIVVACFDARGAPVACPKNP